MVFPPAFNPRMHFPVLSGGHRPPAVAPDTSNLDGPALATGVPTSKQTVAWGQSIATRVVPEETADLKGPTMTPLKLRPRASCRELAGALYHWVTCLIITGLVLTQLLGVAWNSKTSTEHLLYGRSPVLGPSQIVGTNDVPYPDRVIACVRRGQFYEPRLVSSLLAAPGVDAIVEDSTGTAVHGYRLRQRRVGSTTDDLDSATKAIYQVSCALIANTIDKIMDGCSALGYSNLTLDNLRVVDDWDSKNLFLLPNTLPVLIMPYWDNAQYARHAVPTYGGDACIFRLEDAYFGGSSALTDMASFRGVNQSVRHERTTQWLGRPGGTWKNGWYEDLEGMRWYSDVVSSAAGAPYHMMLRLFDMRSGLEMDCSNPSDCEAAAHIGQWGDKFSSEDRGHKFNSVYIANASEFGLFIYEAYELHTVRSVFDWETLVSNMSVGLVLIRWMLALVSLHVGAFRGKSQWFGGGIGCVSGAAGFSLLPLVSLPRLKMTLAAFWTVGCRFEGEQVGLSEAWFAIYPAIVHLVLIYFSLLNLLAKAARRRMSDVLFAPTVLALCLMHYFRLELAASGWLAGIDGRVPTLVFSDEVQKLQLADYFTTDVAWRMDGRVKLLFALKLTILGSNLLPLMLARPFPIGNKGVDLGLHGVEKALGLRARHVGGLGCSQTYIVAAIDGRKRELSSMRTAAMAISSVSDRSNESHHTTATMVTPIRASIGQTGDRPNVNDIIEDSVKHASPPLGDRVAPREIALVNSYELIRLGYLIFGDQYLITFDEWDLLSSMAPFRGFCHFWNHRVLVWTLRDVAVEGDAEIAGGRALASTDPQMWRLDDARLQKIRWWQVSACGIQC